MSRFSSLWKSREFADLELQLVATEQTGESQEEVKSIPLHITLLIGEGDNYFKGRLRHAHRTKGEQGSVGDKRTREDEQPERNADGMLIMKEHCTSEELPAVLAILKFLYLDELPKEPLLVTQIALKSDYWGFHRCTEAALRKLDGLAKASGAINEQVSNLIMDTYPDSLVSRVLCLANVHSQLARKLNTDFRDVHKILTDAALMKTWSELSFRHMLLWASDDELAGDHENSVALLIMAWFNKQMNKGVEVASGQRKQLWSLVRLRNLSPSFYLQVLPKSPFYDRSAWSEEEHQAVYQNIMTAMVSATARQENSQPTYGSQDLISRFAARTWSLGRKFSFAGRVLLQEGTDAAAMALRTDTSKDNDGCRLLWSIVPRNLAGQADAQATHPGPSLYLAGYLWNCEAYQPSKELAACKLRSYLHPIVSGAHISTYPNVVAAMSEGLLPKNQQNAVISVGVSVKKAHVTTGGASPQQLQSFFDVLTAGPSTTSQVMLLQLPQMTHNAYILMDMQTVRISTLNVVLYGIL